MTRITGIRTEDLRFPTSESLDGSDAMNPDPDYSAAYVVLETDGAHEGHGLTFTIGRGNEICVAAIEALGYGGNFTDGGGRLFIGAVSPDSDGDGLLDSWELQFFPDLAATETSRGAIREVAHQWISNHVPQACHQQDASHGGEAKSERLSIEGWHDHLQRQEARRHGQGKPAIGRQCGQCQWLVRISDRIACHALNSQCLVMMYTARHVWQVTL